MRFQRTKRAISTLMAMILIVASMGARDSSCLCIACGTDTSCCKPTAKTCCGSEKPATCGCCAKVAGRADTSSSAEHAANPSAPQGCECISSSTTNIVPLTRPVVVERQDAVAFLPEVSELTSNRGSSFQDVKAANLAADSHPPLRILYCSWIE